jgi:hypothetical protein
MRITKAQARYCRDRIGIVQTDLANIFGLKSAVTVQRLENPAIQTRPDEKKSEIYENLYAEQKQRERMTAKLEYRDCPSGTIRMAASSSIQPNAVLHCEKFAQCREWQNIVNQSRANGAILRMIARKRVLPAYDDPAKPEERLKSEFADEKAELKLLRTALNMTSSECSRFLGLQQNTAAMYESLQIKAHPNDEQLQKLREKLKKIILKAVCIADDLKEAEYYAMRYYRDDKHFRQHNIDSRCEFWEYKTLANITVIIAEQKSKNANPIKMFYPEETPEENEDLKQIRL